MGPLPRTKVGNKFIIVLVDYLTKSVEETGSNEVIKFLKKVFARHSTLGIILTNQKHFSTSAMFM